MWEPEDVIFQQDNDPKHTSQLVTHWFNENGIKVLPWAPSSSDMNIIKHAWEVLDHQLCARNPLPHNLDELWGALIEEWERLDMDTVWKLYTSMPHHVDALREARGRNTQY